MQAMVLEEIASDWGLCSRAVPRPQAHQVLIKVSACAVCRTDLHVVDGDLPATQLPLIPGHEIVGRIVSCGSAVSQSQLGERVGVPWLGSTCGQCRFCRSNRENLCELARFTGYQIDGGYAEYALADSRYCFSIPEVYTDHQAAPLLCAGLIGFRSLRLSGEGQHLGLYGFGAAAHIVIQIAISRGRKVYAFTRPGDEKGQSFARKLGAIWAGGSDEFPPNRLDAAIIFAPDGRLIPQALKTLDRGGVVVCAGIHMSQIPSFSYQDLWGERVIRSVANLTRQDGIDFFNLVSELSIRTEIQTYHLEQANQALSDLRNGRLQGAAVLVM